MTRRVPDATHPMFRDLRDALTSPLGKPRKARGHNGAPEGLWRDREGRDVPIREMGHRHLAAVVAYLRRSVPDDPKRDEVELEARTRVSRWTKPDARGPLPIGRRTS